MHYPQQILQEVQKAVVGKERTVLWTLAAILARGHILLEDIPGVGKTTLALAFSKALGLGYNRVQFTPDVLPSDVTGYSIYDKNTGKMLYQPGAILCNLFLADELNRATSRTQSALLEAMEEGQVTVDGQRHLIDRPFTVIATQNPVGAAGTQLLPDSQMDRFTVCLSMGYPSAKDEAAMILGRQGGNPLDSLRQVVDRQGLVSMQDQVASVYLNEDIIKFAVALMGATRNHPDLLRGGSPRATLAVISMAKAVAYLSGRDYCLPSDIQSVFCETVSHRVILTPRAQTQGKTSRAILEELLQSIKPPHVR